MGRAGFLSAPIYDYTRTGASNVYKRVLEPAGTPFAAGSKLPWLKPTEPNRWLWIWVGCRCGPVSAGGRSEESDVVPDRQQAKEAVGEALTRTSGWLSTQCLRIVSPLETIVGPDLNLPGIVGRHEPNDRLGSYLR